MSVFIIRRLLQSIVVVLAMATIVFFGVFMVGDPTWMFVAPDALPEDIERTRRELGLDRPVWEQYVVFLYSAVQGELGTSFVFGEPA